MNTAPRDPRIVIVGTGFGGVCAAIQLRRAGFSDIVILERAGDVGGTWRDNDYPGCACDVPAVLYSFSFAPNADWSSVYCGHDELYAYLRRTADRYGLRPLIRFGSEVTGMRFDEAAAVWEVSTAAGETLVADVVVNSTGTLSRPAVPRLPGLEDFEGTSFHSADWDHGHDMGGERVAVIGTGASAIQFVPEIAPLADHVDVYQRTPPWVMPRANRRYGTRERALFRRLPAAQRAVRWKTYWDFEWLARGFLGGRRAVDVYRRGAERYIEESIPDPVLRRAVTPDYDPGCKRRLISDDWYPALLRDDVDLVTAGIREIRARSIVTSDGVERPADTIVFGTGFAATDFLAPMKVVGVGGVELSSAWRAGAATHLGVAASDFPNLFLVMGPNTALGHNSIVFMIEAQVRYIVAALGHLRRSGASALQLKRSVQDRTYTQVQKRLGGTVWASGCSSWYLKQDGRNDSLWPATTVEYWWRTRRFSPKAFNEYEPRPPLGPRTAKEPAAGRPHSPEG
ncbi:NAD(P)/FAD-dependent oxidoreductase [Streptomyces sp. SID8352]|uniref:NAD(P)-binding domain-containing protein n=1 Tax=Streptomyces sp. SID8352 TaxID=2690338 RepID=UPI00136C445B|nr:NAD(P)-binding domain-containing protein [Streptomyces sp. SID8352]